MNEEPHNSLNAKLLHAYDLIFAMCEDRITSEQFHELDALISDDTEIRSFYIEMMAFRSSLRRFAFYLRPTVPLDPSTDLAGEEVAMDQLRNSLDESMITTALTDIHSDREGDSGEIFQPPLNAPILSQIPESGRISLNLKRGIAAVLLLAVGLCAYAFLSHGRPDSSYNHRPVVAPSDRIAIVTQPVASPVLIATLNFTQKSVWSPMCSPSEDGKFFAGQSLKLESGAAQLSLQHGGRLVVEGPVEVEFAAGDRFFLHRGKIAATVPGGGLVVDCPNGSVTDLGTQFGLEVNSEGTTEVAVFQGRVSASLRSTATTQDSKPVLLSAGQAATISPTALSMDTKGAIPQQFIRSLMNTDVNLLDVTDLICGGDGTTHRRGIGINPTNGEMGTLHPFTGAVSDGNYHRTTGYPFVDGAFIADVAKDMMIIDSADDHYHFSGIGNTTSTYILTGGKFPSETPEISTVLDGIDYASGDHGMLLIHPNSGLTLDLNAARRIYPDRVLKNFHCRVGISNAVNSKDPRIPNASALVFTDGALRFQNPHFSVLDGSFEVNFPLKETDRFLTLVSVYAGKGSFNRVLWVDAKLDLSAGH